MSAAAVSLPSSAARPASFSFRELQHRAREAAYVAQQLSIFVPAGLAQRALRLVTGSAAVAPDPKQLEILMQRYRELLARDVENVREGLYPESLLFQIPTRTYARRLPMMARDFPGVMRRRRNADYRDLDRAEAKKYPPYFRRTFHWQTDGYLSRRSAKLYDAGVELLFGGTADVMRRQVIPPISRWLARNAGTEPHRLLDVACGTGRTLSQIHAAHPTLRLYGLDLSPYYVQEARELLANVSDASFVNENAEAMPFKDAQFDLATCVYLFHELPRNARRNVLREMFRVLTPGGLCVLEDSAQRVDSREVAFFLERFPEDFHEPFYADYLGDSLEEALQEEGFVVRSSEPHFVAKVVVAEKPR
jgi:ubiquinone/menaquinone biosynthesis C-methylase UbiE